MSTKNGPSRCYFRISVGTLLGMFAFWFPSIGFVNTVDLGTTFVLDVTFARAIHTLSVNLALRVGMSDFTRHFFIVAALRHILSATAIGVVILLILRIRSRQLPAIALSVIIAIPAWNFMAIGGALSRPLTQSLIVAYCQSMLVPVAASLCLLALYIRTTCRLEQTGQVDKNYNTVRLTSTTMCLIFAAYIFSCMIGWNDLLEFQERWMS